MIGTGRWILVVLLGLGGLARAGDPAPQHLLRPDGSSISYYLQQRQPSGPSSSLLVILQGSDCNSVSHVTSIPLLAQARPEADVLTVEKYGLEATLPYSQDAERADCPQAYLEHDSPTQRTDDLQAVIQYLRQQRHYASVIALGGSEGAVIAHALAARPGVVDATVAFNGGGQWFADDLLHSVDSSDLPVAEKAEARQGLQAFIQQVQGQPPADLRASGHGARWWQEVLRLDQLALLQDSHTPALVIQAMADQSVSVPAVMAMIEQLRRDARPGVDFRSYPGLGHRFDDHHGQSHMPTVVDDIALWLRQLPPPGDKRG